MEKFVTARVVGGHLDNDGVELRLRCPVEILSNVKVGQDICVMETKTVAEMVWSTVVGSLYKLEVELGKEGMDKLEKIEDIKNPHARKLVQMLIDDGLLPKEAEQTTD